MRSGTLGFDTRTAQVKFPITERQLIERKFQTELSTFCFVSVSNKPPRCVASLATQKVASELTSVSVVRLPITGSRSLKLAIVIELNTVTLCFAV